MSASDAPASRQHLADRSPAVARLIGRVLGHRHRRVVVARRPGDEDRTALRRAPGIAERRLEGRAGGQEWRSWALRAMKHQCAIGCNRLAHPRSASSTLPPGRPVGAMPMRRSTSLIASRVFWPMRAVRLADVVAAGGEEALQLAALGAREGRIVGRPGGADARQPLAGGRRGSRWRGRRIWRRCRNRPRRSSASPGRPGR